MMDVCGLEVEELPPGYTPLEAVVFIKALDEDGDPGWCRRGTTGLSDEEVVGILTADTQRIVQHINGRWIPDGEDEP